MKSKKRKSKKTVSNKPKKTAKRRVRKVKRLIKKTVNKIVSLPVAVVRKRKVGVVMAKRKGKRKSRGVERSKVSMKHLAMDGAAIVGGVLGGAVISNVIPVADGRIKAAASIGLGVLLAGTNIIKGSIGKMAALGMVAGGTLALIRRSLPTVTALAGEDDLEGLEYDLSGPALLDYSGEESEEIGENPENIGEYNDLETVDGEIEELTGSAELLGAEQWAMAE